MEKILWYTTITESDKFIIEWVDINFGNWNQWTFHKIKFKDFKNENSNRIWVMICAIDEELNIYMIEQFQVVTESRMFLLPRWWAKNWDYLKSAQEELSEEIWYMADKLEELTTIYVSPWYFQQWTKLYLATGLQKSKMEWDELEEIALHKINIYDAIKMIMRWEITDARTISWIFFVKEYLWL